MKKDKIYWGRFGLMGVDDKRVYITARGLIVALIVSIIVVIIFEFTK